MRHSSANEIDIKKSPFLKTWWNVEIEITGGKFNIMLFHRQRFPKEGVRMLNNKNSIGLVWLNIVIARKSIDKCKQKIDR